MLACADQSEQPSVADRLRRPGWSWTLAFLLAGFFTASSLYIAAHRMLWFDEILTALSVRQPDLPSMWKALSQVEQTPPVYFLTARVFDQLFGHSDVALRLPSVLAFGAALLIIFDVARRLTDGLYGLIAMSFVATSFVTYYGHEARAYSLYLMLATMALWLWISTDRRSRGAAAAFGLVFLLGTAIHFYFVLCLVPFGLVALRERRIFDLKVIAGASGILIAAAVLHRQLVGAGALVDPNEAVWSPSRHKLFEAYLNFSSNLALPLAFVAVAALVFGLARDHKVPPMSEGERVCWLFLALPLTADIMARVATHSFHDRYIISAGPGMILGATCLLWRHWQLSGRFSVLLLLAFSGSAVGQQVLSMRAVNHIIADTGNYQERTQQILALEDTALREGKQHVVIAKDVWCLEAWYYSQHRGQLECLTDTARWWIKNTPLQFVSVQDILAHPAQTAVIAPNRAVTEMLERAGFRFKVRLTDPQTVLYPE